MVSLGWIFVYYGLVNGFNVLGWIQMIGVLDVDVFVFFGEVMLGQCDFNGDGYVDLFVGVLLCQCGLLGIVFFFGFLWVYIGGFGGFIKVFYKCSGVLGSVDGLGVIFDVVDVIGDGQMDIIIVNLVVFMNFQGLLCVFCGVKGLK